MKGENHLENSQAKETKLNGCKKWVRSESDRREEAQEEVASSYVFRALLRTQLLYTLALTNDLFLVALGKEVFNKVTR